MSIQYVCDQCGKIMKSKGIEQTLEYYDRVKIFNDVGDAYIEKPSWVTETHHFCGWNCFNKQKKP